MSVTKGRFSKILPLALVIGFAWVSDGCNNGSPTSNMDAAEAGGAGGGTAAGGSTSTGGKGSGGASGGRGGNSADAALDARADVTASTGGSANTGGQTSNGGQISTGGRTGSGGQVGSGGNVADAGPDVTVYRDASTDQATIPDAPVKQDTIAAFWSGSYTANCTPPTISGRSESDGHHRAGEDCMTSGCHLNPKKAHHHADTDCTGSGCHANGSPDGSGAPAFLFGGTAYRASTLVADPSVEVAVNAPEGFYSSCSASNGNFWHVGSSTVTWASATTRLRNSNGEAAMMTTVGAGCNVCHTGTLKITSP
jgi:hypothetical protein